MLPSRELYRIVDKRWRDVVADLGFQRLKRSWAEWEGELYDGKPLFLCVRALSSHCEWGNEFTVNFSAPVSAYAIATTGMPVSFVFDQAGRERVRQQLNRVRSRLGEMPTVELFQGSLASRHNLLSHWRPRAEPFPSESVIYYQYATSQDVDEWMTLLAELLPDALVRARAKYRQWAAQNDRM